MVSTQFGKMDIVATLRQSVRKETQLPHTNQQTEVLPLVTTTTKAKIATASSLVDICREYLSNSEIEQVLTAYRYADAAHLGQVRKSGEPYITHPIAVASILAEWRVDVHAIQAGLMHDVLEDTGISKFEMAEKFGPVTTDIVDGVSKLDKLKFSSNEIAQAESFKKMLNAMSRDVRVILVKLADRLHNLRTLSVMRPEKRRRIAKETMDIYVPMALHLGINHLFREMRELCFQNYYPLRYAVVYQALIDARKSRRPALQKILDDTQEMFKSANIRGRVLGREKTCYGIYNQMKIKHLSFSEVFDIYGFRVVVSTREDCYRTLGALHQMYKPVQGRFKDMIAIPRSNGYQGLHTTVIGPQGTPVEFQIRTEKMNDIAEEGILTHWLNKGDESDIQALTHAWLQSLLDLQHRSSDTSEFYENIKADLFPNRIYVFTPKGRIISLPQDSTAIDFAYQIHTDIGSHVCGCRVNGQVRDITSPLQNGEMIEVTTSLFAHPMPSWLGCIKSGKARAETRQYLRAQDAHQAQKVGLVELKLEAQAQHFSLEDIHTNVWSQLAQDFEVSDKATLLGLIGTAELNASVVLHRLQTLLSEDASASLELTNTVDIIDENGQTRSAQLARCCHPILGDNICVFERAGHGLTVHRRSCSHVQNGQAHAPSQWHEAQWAQTPYQRFSVPLEIKVNDARNAFQDITGAVAQEGAAIVGLSMSEDAGALQMQLLVQVENYTQLMRVIRLLKQLHNVNSVERKFEYNI